MSLRVKAIVGIVAAIAASVSLSGCAGTVVECTGQANNTHRSSGTPSDMVGKATGQCNAPVAVVGYVAIQQQTGPTDWYSIKRTNFSLTTTPGVTFTRQAATSCRKGTFRTYAYVVGTYKGQSETRTSASGTTTNPCG
jgi:hypothetical protein